MALPRGPGKRVKWDRPTDEVNSSCDSPIGFPGIPPALFWWNGGVRHGGISGIHTAGDEPLRMARRSSLSYSAIACLTYLLRSAAAWIPDPLVPATAPAAI